MAQEPEIQIIADFDVAAQQNVTYPLLLHSAPGAAIHTAGFSGSLLRVSGGGALTLENLVLDGSAAGSYQENPTNRTLVQGMGGSIHLGAGAVLQNNSSYQEGGGVYLSGDPSYVNTLLMDGNAAICGCSSRTSGGGLTAALRNNADSVCLAGEALIEQNTAANGAGSICAPIWQRWAEHPLLGNRCRSAITKQPPTAAGCIAPAFQQGAAPLSRCW